MSRKSKIGWVTYPDPDTGKPVAGSTFNPWWGCKKKARRPGCVNCYAQPFAKRMGHDVWDGQRFRFFGDKHWHQPEIWQVVAGGQENPMLVFSGSMCDVFYPNAVLDESRTRLFDLVERTPDLIGQI